MAIEENKWEQQMRIINSVVDKKWKLISHLTCLHQAPLPLTNRKTSEDFPTADSPRSTNLNWQIFPGPPAAPFGLALGPRADMTILLAFPFSPRFTELQRWNVWTWFVAETNLHDLQWNQMVAKWNPPTLRIVSWLRVFSNRRAGGDTFKRKRRWSFRFPLISAELLETNWCWKWSSLQKSVIYFNGPRHIKDNVNNRHLIFKSSLPRKFPQVVVGEGSACVFWRGSCLSPVSEPKIVPSPWQP